MTFEEAMADLMLAQADVFYRPKDDSIDMAIIALKNQHTGHWEVYEELTGEWEGTKKYACDKCGEKVGVFKSNFCPNCGAKMIESQESEE